MAMSIEEIYDNCMQACKKGDFAYIRNNWRFLPSEMRLNVYYESFRTKKVTFVYNTDDMKLIKEWQNTFIESLGLSQEQFDDIYWDYKVPREFEKDKHRELIYRNFAVYSRFREYAELFEKYPYLKKLAKDDYNLLKCNPRRTKARFEFMLYQNAGSNMKNLDILDELTLSEDDFSCIYQKEILEVIYDWKAKDPEAYAIIWKVSHSDEKANETGESYFKFLDTAFLAALGDEVCRKYIDGNREKKREVEPTAEHTTQQISEQTVEQLEEIEMKDIFGVPVMPKEERDVEVGPSKGTSSGSNAKPNKIEKIDEEKIMDFIRKAISAGFSHKGYMTTESGTKALEEDEVFYHLFEKNGNRFIVPIGQVGNSMYRIIDNDISLEELKNLMSHKGRDEAVKEGILERRYNVRSDSQTYDYEASLQKLINIAVLAEEGASEKKKVLDRAKKAISISDVKAQVIKSIPSSEVPDATSYVSELAGKKFIANLLEKTISEGNYDLTEEQVDGKADEQAEGQADKEADEQTDKQAGEQADKQADEQADEQANGGNASTTNKISNSNVKYGRDSGSRGALNNDR